MHICNARYNHWSFPVVVAITSSERGEKCCNQLSVPREPRDAVPGRELVRSSNVVNNLTFAGSKYVPNIMSQYLNSQLIINIEDICL